MKAVLENVKYADFLTLAAAAARAAAAAAGSPAP